MKTTRNKGEDLILAMKEKYLKLILCGRKKVEIRRTTPREGPNKRLWLYFKGHIHGYVEVQRRQYIGDNSWYNWSAVKLVAPERVSGVQVGELNNYLEGAKDTCVYHLGTAHRFKEPYTTILRPQSWMYMPPELRTRLCRKYHIKLDNR